MARENTSRFGEASLRSCLPAAALKGVAIYFLSTAIVIAGATMGAYYVSHNNDVLPRQVQERMTAWDGRWYHDLATLGYSYAPDKQSNVAFFPLYPALVAILARTGMSLDLALLLVPNTCFLFATMLMVLYAGVGRNTSPDDAKELPALCLALFPTSYFFRMAYSESLFVMLLVLAMLAIELRLKPFAIAFLIALATATRLVGLALLVPFLISLRDGTDSVAQWLRRVAIWLPLACGGIVAYCVYLYWIVGDPFVFVYAQRHWQLRPTISTLDKAYNIAQLEPLWSVYDPTCPCCWENQNAPSFWLFNLHAANPIIFGAFCAMAFVGVAYRYLTSGEFGLCMGLLLIPYVTRGHDMCMTGAGRFSVVVFPVFLVLGRLLNRIPHWGQSLILAVSASWLGFYAAMFTAGFAFF